MPTDDQLYQRGYQAGRSGYVNPMPENEMVTTGYVDGIGDYELAKLDDHAFRTGRSKNGTGRLRNFKAMDNDKLHDTFIAILQEANDPEARERVFEQLVMRRLRTWEDRFWEPW